MSERAPEARESNVVSLGLTVAWVARRLGVAPATLRTWDRRYGLTPTDRSIGGHRRYTNVDLARLELMRRYVMDGVPAAEAARAALAADVSEASENLLVDLNQINEIAVDTSVSVNLNARAGGGQVIAIPGGTNSARGLARAANALDTHNCSRIIESSLKEQGVIQTWNELLIPVLTNVGKRWEESGEGVEVEHLLTEVISTQMKRTADRLRAPVNARPVLLTCAPYELHSLPLYTLSAALSERNIGARVLGARTPIDAVEAAIKKTAPSVVLMWSQIDASNSVNDLKALIEIRPAPLILLAGPGWPEQMPYGLKRTQNLNSTVCAIGDAVRA
ncbi:MAG: MerR family transcriptional regulator [Candidatus Nanopelagicales bacterium]